MGEHLQAEVTWVGTSKLGSHGWAPPGWGHMGGYLQAGSRMGRYLLIPFVYHILDSVSPLLPVLPGVSAASGHDGQQSHVPAHRE